MRNQGLSLNTGLNSFLQGFETGERIKARKDEKEWTGELRQRQRQDWKRADTDQVKADALNRFNALDVAVKGGLEVDYGEVEAINRDLSRVGVKLPMYGDPKMQEWVDVAEKATKTGVVDDRTRELFDWRIRDEVTKGVGEVFESDRQVTRDVMLPKGSKIVDKQVARIDWAPDQSGVAVGLNITAETPDGKKVTYLAPATENRTSNDDDPVKIIPLDRIMDLVTADRLILRGIQQSPPAIQSYMARLGGKLPEPEKVEIVKFQDGTDNVMARFDSRGNNLGEIARGPDIGLLSAQVAADARRESDRATASRGGVDQQLYTFAMDMHKDEPNPEKRKRLAMATYQEFKGAGKGKTVQERRDAVILALMKPTKPGERRGTTVPMYTPLEAQEIANQLYPDDSNAPQGTRGADEEVLLQYLMR